MMKLVSQRFPFSLHIQGTRQSALLSLVTQDGDSTSDALVRFQWLRQHVQPSRCGIVCIAHASFVARLCVLLIGALFPHDIVESMRRKLMRDAVPMRRTSTHTPQCAGSTCAVKYFRCIMCPIRGELLFLRKFQKNSTDFNSEKW